MDGGRSFEFDQLVPLQIRQGFPNVGAEHFRIDIVFFGQSLDDFAHRPSIAVGKNFLGRLVEFQHAFGIEQDSIAGFGIGLQPDSSGESWPRRISDRWRFHLSRTMHVMDRIEHRPKHIALELEGAHGVALQLNRIAMIQSNRKRFVGVTSRLGDPAAEVIKAA